ncbi:hypothetical protein GCM10010172_14380 [Paractinoplanes ferrugineus]|uniref:Uncharacterized protein n=1 Tax=Paractinoplanes ferrugineus TaxID=113564 RepID=A0A919IZ70_9ACTN|nr:hypothetical protein Afe05nite_18430 [Actinoplanes ferrugineus]
MPVPPRLPRRALASDQGYDHLDDGWDELVYVAGSGSAAGTQPWRCLWRASVLQMTMTRPCRRMTRQLLQIRLTLGLTFTVCLNSLNGRDDPRPSYL